MTRAECQPETPVRVTITGVLHRSRQRRPHSRDWLKDYIALCAEHAGVRERQYYPEDGYIPGDTLGTTGRPMLLSIRSFKPFGDIPNGARVSCTATVRRWDNGGGHSIGGDLLRVRDVVVLTGLGGDGNGAS